VGYHDKSLRLPDRLGRAAAKRRNEYLAGRCAARQSIRALTGKSLIPDTDHDRAPIWPSGLVGSISHGGGHAVALVGKQIDYLGLGVDIEPPLDTRRAMKLAPQILTDSELRSDVSPEHVSRAFSAKESLFKALYPLTRVWFGFQDAVLVACDEDGQGTLRLCRDLGSDWPRGRCLPFRHVRFRGAILTRVDIPGPQALSVAPPST
jgi:enterobactin synthetase component D